MIRKLLSFSLMTCLLLMSPCLFAGNPFQKRQSLSLQVGYGHLGNGVNGLTNLSQSYMDEMSSGISWNGSYFYRTFHFIGFGFLYSGFSSKGSLEHSTDHFTNHCFIPQVGFYVLQNKHIGIRLNSGIGLLTLRNNSTVYGKPRKVTGNSFAWNLNGDVIIPITKQLCLSVNGGIVTGESDQLRSHYNGEIIKIKYYYSDNPIFTKFNISAGLTYLF